MSSPCSRMLIAPLGKSITTDPGSLLCTGPERGHFLFCGARVASALAPCSRAFAHGASLRPLAGEDRAGILDIRSLAVRAFCVDRIRFLRAGRNFLRMVAFGG